MSAPAMCTVQVVWAEQDQAVELTVMLPPGSSVAEAVARSRLREHCPRVPIDAPVGVWGREVTAETPVSDGDRIEVYRPLPQDPKETRRALARQGRTMGEALGQLGTAGARRPRRR
jgi:putative ubiquitin-RnfH superfamily antitoxin RatB of RatAB toxin-antitoxin module